MLTKFWRRYYLNFVNVTVVFLNVTLNGTWNAMFHELGECQSLGRDETHVDMHIKMYNILF